MVLERSYPWVDLQFHWWVQYGSSTCVDRTAVYHLATCGGGKCVCVCVCVCVHVPAAQWCQ